MISSGRSFKASPSLLAVVEFVRSRSRRPRTLASTRSEPAWRTMPPIRSGSTVRVASTGRPDACSIWPTISSRLVVGELVGRRQLDGRAGAPRAATRRSNSRSISSSSPARPFSTSRQQEVAHELVGAAEHVVERAAPSRAGRAAGSAAARRSSGTSPTAATKSPSSSRTCVEAALLLRGLEEGARVRAVRDGH